MSLLKENTIALEKETPMSWLYIRRTVCCPIWLVPPALKTDGPRSQTDLYTLIAGLSPGHHRLELKCHWSKFCLPPRLKSREVGRPPPTHTPAICHYTCIFIVSSGCTWTSSWAPDNVTVCQDTKKRLYQEVLFIFFCFVLRVFTYAQF